MSELYDERKMFMERRNAAINFVTGEMQRLGFKSVTGLENSNLPRAVDELVHQSHVVRNVGNVDELLPEAELKLRHHSTLIHFGAAFQDTHTSQCTDSKITWEMFRTGDKRKASHY